MPQYAFLPDRALLTLSGEDARPFLQGLVTADIQKLSDSRSLYGALLTPQGKFLHDFFILAWGGGIALDCEEERADDLVRRLTAYKLRSKAVIARLPDVKVCAVWNAAVWPAGLETPGNTLPLKDSGLVMRDPRLAEAGLRIVAGEVSARAFLATLGGMESDAAAYDEHRLSLGLPDGSRDIEVERGLPLEYGLDLVGAVDFGKGCYVGQEVTARTRFRAQLRKALFTVQAETGMLPAAGTPVVQNGAEVGELRSGRGRIGLAFLRLEEGRRAAQGQESLTAGTVRLQVALPRRAAASDEK